MILLKVFTSRKKALNKKQYYSFGLKNSFYANYEEGLLEKYMRPWKKMVSTSQNITFNQQE